MGSRILNRWCLMLGGVALLVAATGCPSAPPSVPEAVLEGTWELTGDLVADEVSDFLITFDETGEITTIRYTVGIINVVINAPASIQSSSNVDGNSVTISAAWLGINNLVFEGTLNDAESQIDGTTTFSIEVGSVKITVPTGDALLIRQ